MQSGLDAVAAFASASASASAAAMHNGHHNHATKRQATQGQWRTPPVPFFPSQPQRQPQRSNQIMPPASASASDPVSDYARALEEAYRRGAEAAAKLSAGQAAVAPGQHGGAGAAHDNASSDHAPPAMFGFDFAAIAAAAGGVGGMGPAAAVTEAMETTTATTTGATASAPTSPDIFGQAPNGVGLAANMISAVSCPNLSSNAAVSPLQIPMPMPMSAGTMTTMTPAASVAAAEVDIDPTPVAEIRAKLAAAQQQQQQQQQHNHNHQHQHQLQNQHQQGGQNRQQYRQMAAVVEAEPDPQAVTEQRQAAADQAARFPGLPPPTLLSVAVADAHQMQQRKMDGRTSASPVLAYAPVPPEEGGEPVPGGQPAAPAVAIVANPLASALCHEANNTPPSPSTTTLGVPTPLPLGPMRIPGMPPGAIHPSQAQVQQAQAQAQQAQAQTQTQTQAQAQAAASSAQQQLQRQQQQGSRSPQTLVGVQLQVQHAVHHHPGTSIPNLVGMSALPGAAGTRMTTTGEHGPIGGAGGGSGSILGGVQTAPTPEEQPRSVSLPDISSYAARADQEEAKRRKRLARNRASARLRRLRKKNLVSFREWGCMKS